MEEYFVKLSKDGFGLYTFESPNKVIDHVKNNEDHEWFYSTFYYNKNQIDLIESNKRATGKYVVAGIHDLVTKELWFDFDGENDLQQAKADSLTICQRLIDKGFNQNSLQIWFSGGRGFHVIVKTNGLFTPKQVRSICNELANGLTTFDSTMYDAPQLLRAPFSRHGETHLYKIPLTLEDLNSLTIEEIKVSAKSISDYNFSEVLDYFQSSNVPEGLIKEIPEETSNKDITVLSDELDLTNKPKFLSNCRYALQQGFFKEGERNTALLCLASTYKSLGFDLDITYRMLKGVAEIQSKRNNQDRYDDTEIYNNICLQVYGPTWKGGTYTCREPGNWLHGYCKKLGSKRCDHKNEEDKKPKTIIEITSSFKHYVQNIDKNTIKTGIPSIDKNVFISTGANVGVIGAAGSGKTAIALNILENTSKENVLSVFASLDMAKNRMYEKAMYKVTGMTREKLYEAFQNGKEQELVKKLDESFRNVMFFSKSSPTVQDIREYILDVQDLRGEKVKLVMLDYFERVTSDISDDTQASKRVAGELQDLVNDLDIALISLVQPNKNALYGGPDQPIYDYTKIKGSSYLYQSFRIIMSLWRPFYNPKDFSKDHFLQMAVLKNDLGELSEFGFNWNGKRGLITELDDHQYYELQNLLKEKENRSNEKEKEWM